MKWKKIYDSIPDNDCGEVIIYTGVVQNTSYFLIDEGMGLYWGANHPDVDGPIPVELDDQWVYISDLVPPLKHTNG